MSKHLFENYVEIGFPSKKGETTHFCITKYRDIKIETNENDVLEGPDFGYKLYCDAAIRGFSMFLTTFVLAASM